MVSALRACNLKEEAAATGDRLKGGNEAVPTVLASNGPAVYLELRAFPVGQRIWDPDSLWPLEKSQLQCLHL